MNASFIFLFRILDHPLQVYPGLLQVLDTVLLPPATDVLQYIPAAVLSESFRRQLIPDIIDDFNLASIMIRVVDHVIIFLCPFYIDEPGT